MAGSLRIDGGIARVTDAPAGKRVRYAGMVICRQRPGTASGVVLLALSAAGLRRQNQALESIMAGSQTDRVG